VAASLYRRERNWSLSHRRLGAGPLSVMNEFEPAMGANGWGCSRRPRPEKARRRTRYDALTGISKVDLARRSTGLLGEIDLCTSASEFLRMIRRPPSSISFSFAWRRRDETLADS
jgi:hypothetical protein